MPALTALSTASVKARRLSSAPVCSSILPVMRLKALASVPTSSCRRGASTRALRSPAATRRAAWTSSETGRTSRSATVSAIQIEAATISSETSSSAALKRIWSVRERSSMLL